MTLLVRELASNSHDLSVFLGTHIVEGEDCAVVCVLMHF